MNVNLHVKYIKRCQSLLPQQYTSQDLNQISLVNFTLSSLDLLKALPNKEDQRRHADWLYLHLLPSGRGFRGSLNAQLKSGPQTHYDPPHLPSTYFAIGSLVILGDDLSRLDRRMILQELSDLQAVDGSFSASLLDQDRDLRFTYMAIAIRHLFQALSLKNEAPSETSVVDVDAATALTFIDRCRNEDGGYGHGESHAGLTFCALSTRYLLGATLSASECRQTTEFLVHRHNSGDGGFNGREGKESDVCYCFWSVSALTLLGQASLVDKTEVIDYLATCQTIIGGYGKIAGEMPDLYHSYLGIAVQVLLEEPDIRSCALSISKRALEAILTTSGED